MKWQQGGGKGRPGGPSTKPEAMEGLSPSVPEVMPTLVGAAGPSNLSQPSCGAGIRTPEPGVSLRTPGGRKSPGPRGHRATEALNENPAPSIDPGGLFRRACACGVFGMPCGGGASAAGGFHPPGVRGLTPGSGVRTRAPRDGRDRHGPAAPTRVGMASGTDGDRPSTDSGFDWGLLGLPLPPLARADVPGIASSPPLVGAAAWRVCHE